MRVKLKATEELPTEQSKDLGHLVSRSADGRFKKSGNKHVDVAHRVDAILKERGIDISYDPDRHICKTWYGRWLKIFYKADGKISYTGPWTGEVFVDTQAPNGKLKHDEWITQILLHEKTHHDIAPIETPLVLLGMYKLYQGIDNPIAAVIATGAAFLAWNYLINEFIIEGICYLKYGLSIFNANKRTVPRNSTYIGGKNDTTNT